MTFIETAGGRFTRRSAVLFAGLSLFTAAAVAGAGQAEASATGCSWWGGGTIGGQHVPGGAAPGRVCGTLKTNGARLTEVCHNIHS